MLLSIKIGFVSSVELIKSSALDVVGLSLFVVDKLFKSKDLYVPSDCFWDNVSTFILLVVRLLVLIIFSLFNFFEIISPLVFNWTFVVPVTFEELPVGKSFTKKSLFTFMFVGFIVKLSILVPMFWTLVEFTLIELVLLFNLFLLSVIEFSLLFIFHYH